MDTQSLNTELAHTVKNSLGKHQCEKCGKAFNSPQALRMHRVRMHTAAGLRGAKIGGQAAVANRKRRNESDRSCPVCHGEYATRAIRNAHLRLIHGKSIFDFPDHMNSSPQIKGKARLRYVYPPPEQQQTQQHTAQSTIKYCPNCGTHLEGWQQI